jgi:hypothetical protein
MSNIGSGGSELSFWYGNIVSLKIAFCEITTFFEAGSKIQYALDILLYPTMIRSFALGYSLSLCSFLM